MPCERDEEWKIAKHNIDEADDNCQETALDKCS